MFKDLLPDYLNNETAGYLVGGALRDLLCGRCPQDYDIAVFEDPAIRASQLAQTTGGHFFKLGASRFTHYRVDLPEGSVDFTPIQGGSIEADLALRDFTINAMAYDLNRRRLIDPLNGMADLNKRLVRMTGPDCFSKDPVRLIRAHRMAAGLKFHLDPDTFKCMADQAPLIARVAGERIWPEWQAILQVSDSSAHIHSMATDGLLAALFPKARWNCADETLLRLNALANLEMIFHQPDTYLPGQAVPFVNGMPSKKRILSKTALLMGGMTKDTVIRNCHRMRTSTAESKWILSLSENRHLALALCRSTQKLHFGAFFNVSGTQAPHILINCLAEHLNQNNIVKSNYIKICYSELLKYYFQKIEPLHDQPPLISGKELMASTGIEPSPFLGKLLTKLKEAHFEGSIQNKAEAIDLARSFINRV